MPRTQEVVLLQPDVFVELTSGEALSWLKFQALDGPITVRRADTTRPDAEAEGWRYTTATGDRVTNLSEISGAAGNRLWGRSLTHGPVRVLVDHA